MVLAALAILIPIAPPSFAAANTGYSQNAGVEPNPSHIAGGMNICVRKLGAATRFGSQIGIIVPKLKQPAPLSLVETGAEDLSSFTVRVGGGYGTGAYALASANPAICQVANATPASGAEVVVTKTGIGLCKVTLQRSGDVKYINTAPLEITHSIDPLIFTDASSGVSAQCAVANNACFAGNGLDQMVVEMLLDDAAEFDALNSETPEDELTNLFEIHFEDALGAKVSVLAPVKVSIPEVLEEGYTHKIWHKHCSSVCANYADYDEKAELNYSANGRDAEFVTNRFSYFGVSRQAVVPGAAPPVRGDIYVCVGASASNAQDCAAAGGEWTLSSNAGTCSDPAYSDRANCEHYGATWTPDELASSGVNPWQMSLLLALLLCFGYLLRQKQSYSVRGMLV